MAQLSFVQKRFLTFCKETNKLHRKFSSLQIAFMLVEFESWKILQEENKPNIIPFGQHYGCDLDDETFIYTNYTDLVWLNNRAKPELKTQRPKFYAYLSNILAEAKKRCLESNGETMTEEEIAGEEKVLSELKL